MGGVDWLRVAEDSGGSASEPEPAGDSEPEPSEEDSGPVTGDGGDTHVHASEEGTVVDSGGNGYDIHASGVTVGRQ